MILSVYIILYLISLVFVISGYYMKLPLLQYAGYTALTLLGLVIITGTLEVPDGSTISTNGSISVITPKYVTYTNFYLGFTLTIAPIWAFVVALFEIRRGREEND